MILLYPDSTTKLDAIICILSQYSAWFIDSPNQQLSIETPLNHTPPVGVERYRGSLEGTKAKLVGKTLLMQQDKTHLRE